MSYVDPILQRESLKNLNQDQIRNALDLHYDRLRRFVSLVPRKGARSLILNGNAGMGKTEFTTDLMEEYCNSSGIECGFVSGTLSAVDLYARLYQYRKEGQVLIIDDTDSVLENTESLEVLKCAGDTKKNRTLTWGKAYSSHLQKKNVQSEFDYYGKIIIITNKLLSTVPDKTPTKHQQQIHPVLSRFNYFRAGLPSNEWKIEAIRMFAENYRSKYSGVNYSLRCRDNIERTDLLSQDEILNEIINFMGDYSDDLRELSFRTVATIIELRNAEPDFWKDMSLANLGI